MRVPFADTSTYLVPDGIVDEDILMLADILPTSYEVGVLNGRVQPGDTVAVVGAGPIGLAAIMAATLFSPSHVVAIDLAEARLDAAKRFGADVLVNNGSDDAVAIVRNLTEGLGPMSSLRPSACRRASSCAPSSCGPGGHVANIGVHGKPATLHLESLWIRDVTMTTGLVDTSSTPTLLRLLSSGQLDGGKFITHHFELNHMLEAYDAFGSASETGALKVVISRKRRLSSAMGSTPRAALLEEQANPRCDLEVASSGSRNHLPRGREPMISASGDAERFTSGLAGACRNFDLMECCSPALGSSGPVRRLIGDSGYRCHTCLLTDGHLRDEPSLTHL